MLGKIISIMGDVVRIKLEANLYDLDNLMGKNVIFEENEAKIVGEILEGDSTYLDINLIGEIILGKFIYGSIVKPSFRTPCRIITTEELDIMYQNDPNTNSISMGSSVIYRNYRISLDVNSFFSNHFAILGNSGSGKSYSTSKILQTIFYEAKSSIPFRTNLFLFDAYGEYQPAFNEIGRGNPNLNYKVITTDLNSTEFQHLAIPFWLLGVDDIALLLNANDENQIPIIEKALKLVGYFTRSEDEVLDQKNDILARSILDIIFSGKSPSEIRNKLTSVLTKFKTKDINLDISLTKGGWSRTVRQCLFVEESGKFADIELVIQYLEGFTQNEFQLTLPDGTFAYGLKEFALALDFALISEGVLTSEKVFDYANVLKIRLNTLMNSDYAKYFEYFNFVTVEGYIKDLLTTSNGRKAQIINFNINYVDDRMAKNLVKIYSKMLFDYLSKLKDRGSLAFHILLEEAHRYVQEDIDIKLFGYNIFERIAKEGRKYGILLGMISQRPSELSETAISQCSNFLVFKMFHPNDLAFVTSILPNISSNLINKLKTFHSGTCIAYGSAFKMPVVVNIDEPNPGPLSQNVNISKVWYVSQQ
ncbi:MAG: ATP-binding protein [Erysipelotrichaceae bacterium]|nr:ATP-binding protein [Erysipelotrichaceae bacterium]